MRLVGVDFYFFCSIKLRLKKWKSISISSLLHWHWLPTGKKYCIWTWHNVLGTDIYSKSMNCICERNVRNIFNTIDTPTHWTSYIYITACMVGYVFCFVHFKDKVLYSLVFWRIKVYCTAVTDQMRRRHIAVCEQCGTVGIFVGHDVVLYGAAM